MFGVCYFEYLTVVIGTPSTELRAFLIVMKSFRLVVGDIELNMRVHKL